MTARTLCIGMLMWLGMVCFSSDGVAFETLTHPGGFDTHAYGIDGSNIVGFIGYKAVSDTGYTDVPQHAFLFNTTTNTWTTLDHPKATGYTRGDCIDGTGMVGFFFGQGGHGFTYDITGDPDDSDSWTTVNYGGGTTANNTFLYGIDGDYLTGRYINAGGMEVGFVYDGRGTWTTLIYPGAYKTRAYGVDGSEGMVTGFYQSSSGGAHAYVYDMSRNPSDPAAWTSLSYPGSNWTFAYGIDGGNIVGRYVASSTEEIGFVYNYTTDVWTKIDYSNTRTYVCDIQGKNIVGLYEDETGKVHGFRSVIPTTPMPTVTSLMINNGAASTSSRTVTLNNTAANNPTQCTASESSSFAGARWLAYSSAPSFTLSSGAGTKRVYFKVRNSEGESPKVNDTISLSTADPEIAISQAGTPVPDNSGSFSFGSVPVKTMKQVTFTIQNLGGTSLNLTGSPRVKVSGPNAADFRIYTQPATPVQPSRSTTFVIAFRPSVRGVRSASVSIANNDSDENPYNFAVTGTGS